MVRRPARIASSSVKSQPVAAPTALASNTTSVLVTKRHTPKESSNCPAPLHTVFQDSVSSAEEL